MDARRQHHGMHAPLQSQQFPPLLQQGGGHPSRLPLPLPHPHMGFSPRPSSFLGGGGYPLAGQKRSGRSSDDGGFTKLFVASLPRNISEDEVRDLFGGFGNVLEVIFLKDKKTGLPQGCCFIKYANAMDAERAIRALDNQRTLQGGPAPLQVKFADSERDHPGPLEHKLFVGSLNKQAGEQEIEEIFAPYGRVENVYVIRDDQKQSRGCAFVTFPEKDMAIAAISALNGIYRMAGCHQPIIVRFADPKRPRSGERESHRMGGSGPNYSPRSHHGGSGPHQGVGGPRGSGGPAMEAHSPAFGWRQGGGAGSMGLLPQAGILPLGAPTSAPAPARKGPLEGSNSAMGFKESPLHKPGQMFGQPLPLQQQPIQQSLPNTSHQNQVQPLQGFSLPQSTDTRSQQHVSVGQYTLPQPAVQMYSQTSLSNNPLQQGVLTSMQQPIPTLSSQPLQFHSLRQQDSQLNQQVQTAQPSQQVHQILPLQPLQPQVGGKETSQQAYLQPLQMMSQSSQQPTTLQPSWSIPVQQQAVPSQQQVVPSQQQAVPLVAMPVTTTVSAAPTPTVTSCEWTEHTSPEGHKYYYNSSTGESRWEKPEEFAVFEQQQQQQQQQQQHQQQQQLSLPQQQQQHHHQQQQQQPQLLQQPQQINPQLVQAQVQAHVQQLQPQQMNPHYQQQQLQPQQVQQVPSQSYQQQTQPQLQQLHQQAQVQQPQLQQLPHLQQLQPQAQLQQLQQSQPQLQQPQREAQFTSSGLQFSQLPTGGAYQVAQGYAHVQAASQPANGIGDASRGPQLQQFTPNQQIPAANGILDPARGAQWMPAMQQGLPNQDWMWKSKPAGS